MASWESISQSRSTPSDSSSAARSAQAASGWRGLMPTLTARSTLSVYCDISGAKAAQGLPFHERRFGVDAVASPTAGPMSPDRGESVNSSPPHRRRLGLIRFENQAEEGVVAGT